MPFQKGQSGNSRGRPVAGRAFADALRVAINEAHFEGGTKLRAVPAKLVDEALNGNMAAIREITDRLDDKVPQAVIGDDNAAPINVLQRIERIIVTPEGAEV